MRKSLFIACVAAIGMAACGPTESDAPTTRTQLHELGQPLDGRPTWEERMLHYLTNRARTEPDAFNPEEPYPPSRPLTWDHELGEAALFHARHIIEQSCWCEDHSSCCELGMVDGEVQCTSGNLGCGATSASARVSMFDDSYNGENMARGHPTPQQAIEGWIFSSGHWQNINNSSTTSFGGGQYSTAWVQDFGRSAGGFAPIFDGIHFSAGALTTFGITYHQKGTGGPQSALVIVEGACHELTPAYGTAEHGAFETDVDLATGCHRYYFYFRDGDGGDFTYPDTGSLGAAVGAFEGACPLYLDSRPADECSPVGQTCETGHTRFCYTGPFGTKDVGVCTSGVERCIGGQWTGECRNEVHPDDTETCGNDADDDCDGEVDEDCASTEDDAPDASMDEVDAGVDAGSTAQPPPAKKEPEGCAVGSPRKTHPWLIMILGAVIAAPSRRKSNRRKQPE